MAGWWLPKEVEESISFDAGIALLEGIASRDDQLSDVTLRVTAREAEPRMVLRTSGRLRTLRGMVGRPMGVTGEVFAVGNTAVGLQSDCSEVRLFTTDGADLWTITFASAHLEWAFAEYGGGLPRAWPAADPPGPPKS